MATRDVKMTFLQWSIAYQTLSDAPWGAGPTAKLEEQMQRYRLWSLLRDKLEGRTENRNAEIVIPLSGRQRRMLNEVMANHRNWKVGAMETVWDIREALGWTRPDLGDFDDEDDGDDEDEGEEE